MRLREELNRTWVPGRFVRPAHLGITPIAKMLEEKFGGVPKPVPPMPNMLKEVERKLIEGRGNIAELDRRQCKAIPFLLWTSPQGWSENEQFLQDYLAWADRNWRAGPRQLWRHYLLNMDPGSLATRRIGAWIEARADRLSLTLQAFSKKWDLFRPNQAIAKLGGALLANAEVIAEIESLKIGRDTLLKSAFLLSVLETIGEQLKHYRQSTDIALTLKSLLTPLGDTPTHKMQGPADLREGALRSIVEGLVKWAENQKQIIIEQTLDLIYQLIGDPRLPQCQGRWQAIDAAVREVVEQWLTKVTIDAFFRFMRELHTDRDDMVREREQFWRAYERAITRAWLITGRDGEPLAVKLLDKSFAKFASGANVQRDHLGLMFRIGSYVVLEMNKTGSTLFWPAGDQDMPGFFLHEYNRASLINSCPQGPDYGAARFKMKHMPTNGWYKKYVNQIYYKTNVKPTRPK
jgi:hypothetical protein